MYLCVLQVKTGVSPHMDTSVHHGAAAGAAAGGEQRSRRSSRTGAAEGGVGLEGWSEEEELAWQELGESCPGETHAALHAPSLQHQHGLPQQYSVVIVVTVPQLRMVAASVTRLSHHGSVTSTTSTCG